jgi:steroid 5-alpha reductase family enzyme
VGGLLSVPFGITAGASLGAILVLMAGTFAVAKLAGRHSVIDTTWGIGLAVVAVVSLLSSAGHGYELRRVLLTVAAVAWGARLAVFTGWRSRGQGEDPRYRDLLGKARGHPDLYALRVIYLTQALVMWLACLPIMAGMVEPARLAAVTIIGAVIWLAGFVFESVGDAQLARFKADPAHRGVIMDRGLWRYTRHPNYFGDACMWWGLFVLSIGSWLGLVAVISPLLMTYVLVRGTGARLTDQRMADRPGYAEYMARTSGFFPLPPRRGSGISGVRG